MKNAIALLGGLALVSYFSLLQGAELPTNQAALDQAFSRLQTYDWGQSREALGPLDDAINASFRDPAFRRRLAIRLAAVLSTNAPTAAKVVACERLSRIGSAESVPALAALLPNPELSHMARYALVRISGPDASRALRRAIPILTGKLKAGVINSLGLIQDEDAVGLLTGLLADPDRDTSAAAAAALGSIGSAKAARALGEFRQSAPKELQANVTAAWLLAAERLMEKGQRSEAIAIFRQLNQATNPVPVRLAAFRGLISAEPAHAAEMVSQALAGDDDHLRSLAGRLLVDAADALPLTPFLQSFKKYPAAAQVAILEAARWRQAFKARPFTLDALQSNEPGVRLAALHALAVIGTAADVPLLARKSAEASAAEREAARAALVALPGKDVMPAVTAQLQTASPEESVELLRSLAARRAVAATPVIVERLAAPNEAVRLAALEALAVLGGTREILPVMTFLKTASDEPAREQAEKTLQAIIRRTGPAAAKHLLTGLKDAPAESQATILRALGLAGGSEALEAVRAFLQKNDSPVRGVAFQVLTGWSGPEAAPELLGLAQNPTNNTWAVLAFRGYVRLCREVQIPATEKKRMLTDAMAIAKNPEQKRLVISALGELRDLTTLNLLNTCLADPNVTEETCLAIVEVAANSAPENKDDVAPALRQVVKLSKNPEAQKAARRELERLAAKPD